MIAIDFIYSQFLYELINILLCWIRSYIFLEPAITNLKRQLQNINMHMAHQTLFLSSYVLHIIYSIAGNWKHIYISKNPFTYFISLIYHIYYLLPQYII